MSQQDSVPARGDADAPLILAAEPAPPVNPQIGPAAADDPRAARHHTILVVLALLSVYIFWGSTYLAIRLAVDTIPPYLLAGVRFLVSGVILMGVARWAFGAAMPTQAHWRTALVTGLFLLLGGNCTVVWASQDLPSSVVALLIGVTPLYAALLEWLWLGKARPSVGTGLALAAGFAGVLVLTAGAGTPAHPLDPVRVGAVLVAALSWTAGSLWSRSAPQTTSPLMNAAAQMVAGGTVITVISVVNGDWALVRPETVSWSSMISMAYLIVFGSLIGYSAYVYTLETTSATLATTYAFVNPLVAVALGAGLAGETLDWRVGGATALIVGAVAALTLGGLKRKRAG